MPTPSPTSLQVRSFLTQLGHVLSPGKPITLRWDRSGAGDFDLIGGQAPQWTFERIYGRLGKFSIDGTLGIVQDPSFQYELRSNGALRISSEFDLPGFADKLVPKSNQTAGTSAEPVGAIGLLTIFSALSIIWTLLNPRLTLHLPGTMEMKLTLIADGSLFVEFITPPTATVVFGIRFSDVINSVRLKENSIDVSHKAWIFAQNAHWEW